MAFCAKCGSPLEEGAKFCPNCGAPVGAPVAPEETPVQPTPAPEAAPAENKFVEAMNNTPDTTAEFDPKDIETNKVMAILSYLGILVLAPILGAKESKFARFHANQGLVLCIVCILFAIATGIITAILAAISWRLAFISTILSIVNIAFVVLAIMGIINAANGKAKELPIIGKYRILK